MAFPPGEMKFRTIDAPLDESPQFFQFVNLDDSIEGRYLGMHSVTGQYGEQEVADVETPDGVFRVNVNASLRPKLAKVRRNSHVRITFTDEKENGNKRDGTPLSPTKLFKVEVAEEEVKHPTPTRGAQSK